MTHLRLMISFEKEPLTALFLRLLTAAMLFLSMPGLGQADTIKIGGTGGAIGTMKVLGEAFRKVHPQAKTILVPGLGSGGGRKALMGGAIDIAVTSAAGKDSEKLDGAAAALYGRTPFVFATSKKNPVSGLTTQEIVDIWSLKRTTWPDGSRLRLILRPATDSDTALLKSISPAMAEAVKSALAREGMKSALSDSDSADALETIEGALGTSSLALIISEKRSLKALAVNGVTPSPRTIADGTYPYFKSLYLLTGPKPSQATQEFVSFVRSARGRETLGQLGHWTVEGKISP
jgi:phosphate transport system substrate-binding protein